MKLQIWDTAGQERFSTITQSYYHNSNGIIIVYDVTDRESFDAINKWVSDVDRLSQDDVCKVLIGNKVDLEAARCVSTKEGQDMAASLGIPFMETSAKSAQNVENLFMSMARFIRDSKAGTKLDADEKKPMKISGTKVNQDQGSCFC